MHFEDQVELLAGEGLGPLKSHCVCPHEGSCLRKVITRCSSGHGLIRKFVVSGVEVKTSQVDSRGPDPLHPRSVRYLSFDCGAVNCVQESEMEDSCDGFLAGCSPGSLRDLHLTRQCEIARAPTRVHYAGGTAVVIRRSAEPQMQRTLMFLSKLFGYCSC